MAPEITRDHVRMAYQLFLGRDPESEQVIDGSLAYGTVDRLRAAFIGSAEFRCGLDLRADLVPVDAPANDVEWTADGATLDLLLAHVRSVWNRLGQEAPHWSVLSSDAFLPENAEKNAASFYASGEADAQSLEAILRRAGLAPSDLPHVFEFGCGIGRVTPFLARKFSRVTACDVSATHLAMATRQAAADGASNVNFVLSEIPTFGMTAPFDLWFSRIVLQHNSPPVIARILRRAFTQLAPGGIAVFQLPTYAAGYRFRIADYLAGAGRRDGIEMHVLPQPVVFELAAQSGLAPVEVLQDRMAGSPATWISNTFVLRKPTGRH